MLLHHPASILQVFLMQMSVQNDCTDVIVQVLFLRLVTMDLRVLHHVHEHGLRSPSSRKHAVLAWVESTESASARRLTTRTLLVSIFGVWIRRCQPASRPAGQPASRPWWKDATNVFDSLRFANLSINIDVTKCWHIRFGMYHLRQNTYSAWTRDARTGQCKTFSPAL